MVSTTHHVTAQQRSAQSHAIGAANVPETDGFDFMSYLLGLQVGAQPENMLTENDSEVTIPVGGKKPEAGAEDPLLSIFGKKKDASWNPMFPGGLSVAPNASPMNVIPQMKVAAQGNSPVLSNQTLMNATVDAREMSGKDSMKLVRANANSVAHESRALLDGTQSPIQAGGEELKGAHQVNAKGQESLSKLALQGDQASVAGANALDGQKHAKVQAEGGNKEAFTSNIHALQPKEASLETKKSEHRQDFADSSNALGLGMTPATKASDGTPATQSVAQSANQTTVPELFSKVESMVHNGGGKMTVSLTPPHLGKVEIQVTTRGKKVEIAINSQNDLAKSVLESKLGDLKHSLHSHDLQLSKVEVQVGKDLARPSGSFGGSSFANLAGGNNAYQQQSQGSWNQQSGRSFGQGGQESSRSTNPTSGRLAATQPTMMGGAAAVRSNPNHVDIRI